jgi:multidrug efflux pump subunit AcrA (membrane-fusion protein)
VQRRPITLGTLGESSYVVESGLHEGDRVAVSSLQSLRDGAAVKVKGAPPAPVAESVPGTEGGGSSGGAR